MCVPALYGEVTIAQQVRIQFARDCLHLHQMDGSLGGEPFRKSREEREGLGRQVFISVLKVTCGACLCKSGEAGSVHLLPLHQGRN